jgi:hypothetical protein
MLAIGRRNKTRPIRSEEKNNQVQRYADFLQQRRGGRCGAWASSTRKTIRTTNTEKTMKKTNEFLLGLRLHGEADRTRRRQRRRKRNNLQKKQKKKKKKRE